MKVFYFNLIIHFNFSSIVCWRWGHKFIQQLARVKCKYKSGSFSCCFLVFRYLISSFILRSDAFCCVNFDAGEVFGIFTGST